MLRTSQQKIKKSIIDCPLRVLFAIDVDEFHLNREWANDD
jgi:hypothetical protein